MFSARDLYARGMATLVASWEAYNTGSDGAAVASSRGVATAVFPADPGRSVYNNALLDRDLDAADRAAALDAMEAVYASAGVRRFAAWVHESDEAMRSVFAARGYTVQETTRAMGIELRGVRVPVAELDIAAPDWSAYVSYLERFGVPEGLLAGVDPGAFRLLLVRRDGELVATGLGFDRDGDRGIYNVSTVGHARRRGLGSAVTARLVDEAAARGSRTASLQATDMAERVYAALGFRDLGRYLEYGR
jgi:GNAT superfamily N-acetyltransferase